MIDEKSWEELEELLKAIDVAVDEGIDIFEDEKIKWNEMLGLVTKVPIFVKGGAGVEKIVPIIKSVNDEVVDRRRQLIKDTLSFNLPVKEIELHIEIILNAAMLLVGGVIGLANAVKLGKEQE